jgi:hypothetical protein
MANPNEAQINLTVDTFVANPANPSTGAPAGPFCQPSSLAFVLDGSGQPINASGQVKISGTNITVTRIGSGSQPFFIQLNLGGAGGPFTAQKIVFVQSNLAGDPDGSKNLKDRRTSGAVVDFKDHWVQHGPKGGSGGNQAPAWKYYIRVQQTTSGQFGWIDPDIENQD